MVFIKNICFSVLILFAITTSLSAKTVVFLGDSLTAGQGVKKEHAYPSIISNKLKEEGHSIKVINASISGSTTASAVSRLKWVQKMKPDLIFLALGANDGLRGLSVKMMEQNLSDAIEIAITAKIKIILAGMEIPPNYGQVYTDDFRQVFKTLSEKHNVPFIPFLLKDVGGFSTLNQADGIHPNKEGHIIMANTVYPYILKEIE